MSTPVTPKRWSAPQLLDLVLDPGTFTSWDEPVDLSGIDPDYRIHVSDALLSINDGPMFEHGVKALDGRVIHLPSREIDFPSRDRLAQRFEEFLRAR